MRHYKIEPCDGKWQMTVDGYATPTFRRVERELLMELASKLAAANDGMVSVYNEKDSLEFAIRFDGGTATMEKKDRAA